MNYVTINTEKNGRARLVIVKWRLDLRQTQTQHQGLS